MKEIKAYVRTELLNSIIEALEEANAKDITVIDVEAIGKLCDNEADHKHFFRKYYEKYSKIAKIEIVCIDENVDNFVEIIKKKAHTGEKGDGRIFIYNVEKAINIRTGETGHNSL